jgi:hypothetical protein
VLRFCVGVAVRGLADASSSGGNKYETLIASIVSNRRANWLARPPRGVRRADPLDPNDGRNHYRRRGSHGKERFGRR